MWRGDGGERGSSEAVCELVVASFVPEGKGFGEVGVWGGVAIAEALFAVAARVGSVLGVLYREEVG